MDKETQVSLVAQARNRVEQGDAAIATQLAFMSELKRLGADTAIASTELNALFMAQDAEMAAVERLLVEMDRPEATT